MYLKFLEGMTSKITEKWMTNLLTPAFAFWSGGLTAFIYHVEWDELKDWGSSQNQSFQVGLMIISLIVIVTSAKVAQSLDQIMLRFLGGYWPRWMKSLHKARRQRYVRRWKKNLQRWSELHSMGEATLTFEELEEYARLDWLIVHSPSKPNRFMPTRLGNLLRAAEYRSKERYGLDAAVCWPRLWLLLPDRVQQELQEARLALDNTVRICFWSLLFIVWTPLAWWAPLIAIPVACFGYHISLQTATVYVDLLESTFDIYRHSLYQALRQKQPTNPAEELYLGHTLTKYLWRGADKQMTDFDDSLEK